MIAKISRLRLQLSLPAGFAVRARVRLAADDGIGAELGSKPLPLLDPRVRAGSPRNYVDKGHFYTILR